MFLMNDERNMAHVLPYIYTKMNKDIMDNIWDFPKS